MNKCEQYCRIIKRLCNSVSSLLPIEYQQVEYLQSAGTQGIDTGVIIPDNYFRVECMLKCTLFQTQNANTRFFGSQANVVSIVPWSTNGTSPFDLLAVGSSWSYHPAVQTYVDTLYTIDVTADNGSLTGTYCGATINTTYGGTVASGKSEGLFYNHSKATAYQSATTNEGASAIYYFRMYTSAGLVRDFIPCYRKSDSEPGMYDLVTNTFFTNIGTGEFTVGLDVN